MSLVSVIDTGLPALAQPFSWATQAAGLIFTAQGPVRQDGTVHTGSIEEQTRLTFENLQRTAKAAGTHLGQTAQVLITLTDVDDMPIVDAIYKTFFRAPYPNRSTSVAKALVVPGMRIEIVAYLAVPPRSTPA